MFALLALALLHQDRVQVTSPDFAKALEPQLAIDQGHTAYVAFGMANKVYVCTSKDEGASFSAPVQVAELPKLALGFRRGPRIAAVKGVVTVSAVSHETGSLVAFKSVDGAKTWSGPVVINDADQSAREGLHAMAAAPDGTLACTWLDLRAPGTRLYLSVSRDGGSTWSANRLAYASPSGTVCECCHPSLAFDSRGKLYVMFRNFLEGSRDMYLTTTSDLGSTFSPAKKLGVGTWPLNACPMDGGALIASAKGVEAIWRREGTLYRSGASGPERAFAEGQQGWISSGARGPFMTWSDGRRILASTPTAKTMELSARGYDSVVASSPDGKLTLAAWAESGIRALRLR